MGVKRLSKKDEEELEPVGTGATKVPVLPEALEVVLVDVSTRTVEKEGDTYEVVELKTVDPDTYEEIVVSEWKNTVLGKQLASKRVRELVGHKVLMSSEVKSAAMGEYRSLMVKDEGEVPLDAYVEEVDVE